LTCFYFRKKKKKSSKSSKEKMERALREGSEEEQRFQDIEKTEAERKFEETKRQRVGLFSGYNMFKRLKCICVVFVANGKSLKASQQVT
jgi:hypothetical protein